MQNYIKFVFSLSFLFALSSVTLMTVYGIRIVSRANVCDTPGSCSEKSNRIDCRMQAVSNLIFKKKTTCPVHGRPTSIPETTGRFTHARKSVRSHEEQSFYMRLVRSAFSPDNTNDKVQVLRMARRKRKNGTAFLCAFDTPLVALGRLAT